MTRLVIVTRKDGVSYVRGFSSSHTPGANRKPRAPRPDKKCGAWVTRPCAGGNEFYWDRNAKGDGKTVHCPKCGTQLAFSPK